MIGRARLVVTVMGSKYSHGMGYGLHSHLVGLGCHQPGNRAYNGAVRLAVDARKLTDFGIGTYLCSLLRGLEERRDVELSVVVRPGHEARVHELAPSAKVLSTAARGYSLAEHIQLPATLWRERVDVVHIPHYVVPAFLPRPIVTTIHDVIQLFYPPAERAGLALFYLRLVMRSALRRSRVVITVSRTSRRDLINLFSADPGRLVVIPNGVDPELAARPSVSRGRGPQGVLRTPGAPRARGGQ